MASAALSEKSPEAFRTISEVAEMLDVPQHVLRFWETRFAHIKPIKRAGGRRFYRPEDVDLLRGIRTLLYYDGYTIRGAQKILREKGARFVVQIGREEMRNGAARQVQAEEFGRSDEIEPFEEPESESNDSDFDVRPAAAPANGDARALLDEKSRASLKNLLEDLLALKSRLAEARERSAG